MLITLELLNIIKDIIQYTNLSYLQSSCKRLTHTTSCSTLKDSSLNVSSPSPLSHSHVEVKSFAQTTATAPSPNPTLDPNQYGPSKIDEFKEPRFLEQVKLFFDRAASKTDVPQEYLSVIKACNTVIRFNIPLRRDNGKIETVTCYRYPQFN